MEKNFLGNVSLLGQNFSEVESIFELFPQLLFTKARRKQPPTNRPITIFKQSFTRLDFPDICQPEAESNPIYAPRFYFNAEVRAKPRADLPRDRHELGRVKAAELRRLQYSEQGLEQNMRIPSTALQDPRTPASQPSLTPLSAERTQPNQAPLPQTPDRQSAAATVIGSEKADESKLLQMEALRLREKSEELERLAKESSQRKEVELRSQLSDRRAELDYLLLGCSRGCTESQNRQLGLEHFRYYQLPRMSNAELFKLSHWAWDQPRFSPSNTEIQAELLPRLQAVYSQGSEKSETRIKQYFDSRYTRLGPATEIVGLLSSVKLDWNRSETLVSDYNPQHFLP